MPSNLLKKVTSAFSIVLTVFLCPNLLSQSSIVDNPYESAFLEIEKMIDKKSPYSFKDAVFLTEAAWFDGMLDYEQFLSDIEMLKDLSLMVRENDSLEYEGRDVSKIRTHASIFRIMSDTLSFSLLGNDVIYEPFTYDFEDVFGDKDWSNMFVTKLLLFKRGNCLHYPICIKSSPKSLGSPSI